MAADYDDFRPRSRLTDYGNGIRIERTIQVRAADEIAARAHEDAPKRGDALAIAELGSTWQYLYCNNISVEQVERAADDSGFLFEITASWQTLDKTPVESKARWSVSGQNEQVRQRAVAAPADQVNYVGDLDPGYEGQGINVTEDGAEGVDVDDPYEVLRIDLWVAPADVAELLETIRGLRRCVNQAAFEGPWGSYAAGEARLHTYNVSHVNTDLDQVSIEFLCLKNVTGMEVTLADGTEVEVDKEGHQYYWQRNVKRTAPADQTKTIVDLVDVHVATLYAAGDFSALGITADIFV